MFRHFISYGSTDQESLRDLVSSYDALIVPGTIAAFQSEGTKGFVLSLSARHGKPYAIDSRFPLFQNALATPKKSHGMLADVFGDPGLIRGDRRPSSLDFPDARNRALAENWGRFNSLYDEVTTKAFDKYAARLGEDILPDKRELPDFVLPPYAMVEDSADGWAQVSRQMFEHSVDYLSAQSWPGGIRRVLAATSPELVSGLLDEIRDEDLFLWVSGLDEYRSTMSDLVAYGQVVMKATRQGNRPTALYGGFFSVLLSRYGLTGASHGVGFGDHRSWLELPSSGAPPARYYVARLHKYVPVDLAVLLWRQFPTLIVDSRLGDPSVSPGALTYHDLMKHSLRARALEIDDWSTRSAEAACRELDSALDAFRAAVDLFDGPQPFRKRAAELYQHLGLWSQAIRTLG
jgi:hypothetical protein